MNFMDLARAARSLPETTTSQPLAPDSMMKLWVLLEVGSRPEEKRLCIPEDTVACTTDGKTVEELVAEGLALSDSGETARLDLSGVEGDAVGGELVTVGDQAGKL